MGFLAERLGFSRERTVAFGDGENDLELSSGAASASRSRTRYPRVKEIADWVCPPAAEEGVAQVIEAVLDSRA